ncbi:MAG: hypothetical protein Q8L21_02935 [Candidatus Komeilibacteria bacterium]|nr:hypothetical protein [Candidatus Komeilibacteria bacterium]
MPTLNLLPDCQKNRLNKERTFLLTETVVGSILMLTIASSIILTVARLILIDQYNKIKHDTSLVNVERLILESRIDSLNDKIRTADKIQQNFSKWSDIVYKLTATLPADITLSYLQLNRETKILRLNGQAKNRDSLLAAKTALEAAPLIKSLEAPLSNLLEKNNIEFRFIAQLRDDAFAINPVTPK